MRAALRHRVQHFVFLLVQQIVKNLELLLRRAATQHALLVVGEACIFQRGLFVAVLTLLVLDAQRGPVDHHPRLGILGIRHFAVHHVLDQLRRRIAPGQLERRHTQRVERCKLGFENRIFRDAVGVKLDVDPLLEPQLLDLCEIVRPRAEGQAVERVRDLLIVRKRNRELRGLGGLPAGRQRQHRYKREEKASPHRTILLNAAGGMKLREGDKY